MNQENNAQPLISVIVPVYNGRNYLRGCVESIQKQTYTNIEIIIIDDGSTDGTAELCVELAKEDTNISILHLEDKGVSAARNAGLDSAKGAYISFVDADDRILPEMLETLYATLQETDSDIAGCSFFAWNTQIQWQDMQKTIPANKNTVEKKCFDRKQYLTEAILQGNSRCWSKLYKSSILTECRFREGLTIGEDMLFLVDLLPKLHQVVETTYAGYGYFQNPHGAMYRKFRPEYMDQIRCWEIARQQVMKIDTEAKAQATALILTGIMLTIGKLAMLSKKERQDNRQYIVTCHQKLIEELSKTRAVKQMSKGYQIKISVFAKMPNLYLSLYHLMQSIKGKRS